MKKFFILAAAFLAASSVFSQATLTNLYCENLANPVGIDIFQPHLSWQINANGRNVQQTAYEIRVSAHAASLARGRSLVWHTGKVMSNQSVGIPYAGASLEPVKKYYWQVRVWDNSGRASGWSPVASWQMAFRDASSWKAKWIQAGYEEDTLTRPSPLMRKEFTAAKKIKSATAFITAHGLYEAHINGKRVGEAYLTPGWTSYNKRLQYQVYDVTALLKSGVNAMGVALGNGWYRGNLVWGGNKDMYGKELSLLMQLHIEFTDGSSDVVVTDETWKSSTGEVRSSEIYHGEIIDARMEQEGWTTAGFDDSDWSGVKITTFDNDKLVATYNEPVKKHEEFKPIKIFTTPRGEQVIDFGQNLVGFVRLKIKGAAGDKVAIHHAEILDKEGNFYTENLRLAKQRNEYTLDGRGEEVFEPHFTFQGFRYIRIEGFPGQISPENFTAVALYSDMKPTGGFTTSNALINQLQHNIEWGQKGNFLDVPTDCPQRDERLGWTGDAQVFSRTAAFNMGVYNFFAKWMKDLAADQEPNGGVAYVVPNVLGAAAVGSAGWADAATIIPWNMYLAYGDKRILEQQYPSMKAWVEYMRSKSRNDLWNTGFHFGDWLFYRPDDDNDGRAALTDKYLITQCFYAHSTQLLVNAARVLGNDEDVQSYSALLNRIKSAFVKEYVTAAGRLVSSSQTAYVLALHFDMLPEAMREVAAGRLVANIKDYNYHLTTGFLGTPYLCHVLTRFGHHDVAYTLLMQDSYPSWLYPVTMGATTIWERWDGQKPDSTFQTPGMNSFNHYAYGAIGDWMYRVICGLDTDNEDGVGYKKIVIKPHPFARLIKGSEEDASGIGFTNLKGGTAEGKTLSSASASLLTSYGKLASSWKIENGSLVFDVTIPCNTTATVYVPGEQDQVNEGGMALNEVKSIKIKGTESGYVVVELGSGQYRFTAPAK